MSLINNSMHGTVNEALIFIIDIFTSQNYEQNENKNI